MLEKRLTFLFKIHMLPVFVPVLLSNSCVLATVFMNIACLIILQILLIILLNGEKTKTSKEKMKPLAKDLHRNGTSIHHYHSDASLVSLASPS